MAQAELKQFLEEVMRTSSGHGSFGGATAGLFGTSRVNQDVRNVALAFAAEYTKQNADPTRLAELSAQVEGSLNSMAATGVISTAELDALLLKLHDLTNNTAQK